MKRVILAALAVFTVLTASVVAAAPALAYDAHEHAVVRHKPSPPLVGCFVRHGHRHHRLAPVTSIAPGSFVDPSGVRPIICF